MPDKKFATKILGTGSAFPARRMTNHDFPASLETSDEWIRERTGIVERRVSERGNPEEHNSSLACKAAKLALEMSGKKVEEIDAIFYATCTGDMPIPSTACWLQNKLGAKRAFAMDLNAACSGFVFALSTADQFIRSGQIKTAIVVGADLVTAFTNWKDRSSCILFGDAAGAAVVERVSGDSTSQVLSTHLGSDGTLWELIHCKAGGSNIEVTGEVHEQGLDKISMKGRDVFKIAVKTLADYAVQALEANQLKLTDIDWFVPHQANLRIIEAVAKRLEVPMDRVLVNIERYGNSSSATCITALDEAVRDGRIKPGQIVLMDVFGAGLTYGSALIRW